MDAPRIHPQFRTALAQIERDLTDVEGLLARRDVRFLAMCAAHPRAQGEILEIGAYRGKSTITLAKAAELAGGQSVISVDPLHCEEPPDHPATQAIRRRIEENLTRKGVRHRVEFHQQYSHDFAQTWNRPIRLLWVDGDHRLAGVKRDLADFTPWLQDGAILVMHDVLSLWDGCSKAFIDDVLSSAHYGQCGVYGNIGWAQYRANPADTEKYLARKQRLMAGLRPLLPFQHAGSARLHGFKKLQFRFLRWSAQSRRLPPEQWLQQVA